MKKFWKEHKSEIIFGLSIFLALLILPNILMCFHAPWTVTIVSDHSIAWLSYLGNIIGTLFSAFIAAYFAYKLMNRQIQTEANENSKQRALEQVISKYSSMKNVINENFSKIFTHQLILYEIYIRYNRDNIKNYEYDFIKHRILYEDMVSSMRLFINSNSIYLSWIIQDLKADINFSELCKVISSIGGKWDTYIQDNYDKPQISVKKIKGSQIQSLINEFNKLIPQINKITQSVVSFEREMVVKYYGDSFSNISECYPILKEFPLINKDIVEFITSQ